MNFPHHHSFTHSFHSIFRKHIHPSSSIFNPNKKIIHIFSQQTQKIEGFLIPPSVTFFLFQEVHFGNSGVDGGRDIPSDFLDNFPDKCSALAQMALCTRDAWFAFADGSFLYISHRALEDHLYVFSSQIAYAVSWSTEEDVRAYMTAAQADRDTTSLCRHGGCFFVVGFCSNSLRTGV